MAGKKRTRQKPAKAKGTLPSPKISSKRVSTPWYKKRLLVAGIVFGLVVLGMLVFKLVTDAQAEGRETRQLKRAIERFENSFIVLEGATQTTLAEVFSVPETFEQGALDAEAFQAKTDEWLEVLRDLTSQLRETEVAQELEDSRALLLDGALLFIDSVKVYQQAITEDVEKKALNLQLGRNLRDHASSVFGLGRRALEAEKRRAGLEEEGGVGGNIFLDRPVPLPEEDVPAQPPPDAELPPGQVPVPVPGP